MKTALVTIAIGDRYQKMAKVTHPTLKAYADRIGAEFVPITRVKVSRTTPHFEKFQMGEMLDTYDRIIYMDTDMVVRDDCPNLFEIVPDGKLGVFNEAGFTPRDGVLAHYCRQRSLQLPPGYKGKYFNTGIMVLSKDHRGMLEVPEDMTPSGFYEQDYLNWLIARNGYETYDLPYRFNRMTCMDTFTGEDRHASYVIHYAGAPGDINWLIKSDVEKWKASAPEYKFKRHLLVYVNGGFGDQVSAEPAVRYLVETAYPGEDINLVSHWPVIFRHLADKVTIHEAGQLKLTKDTPYYVMRTLADDNDNLAWRYLSHALIHPVDYATLLMLRCTIPDADKTIKLKVELSDVAALFDAIGLRTDMNEMVAVHPGRGWPSKTFPKEYWNSIIEGLVDAGQKVVIIGKDISEEQGTVDVDVPEGVLDTRNKLSSEMLFALLTSVKCLVSNDSVPVHIAGAGDAKIVLIATCKHPDHILPYRHGLKRYKAYAMYGKLTGEDQDNNPTNIEGETINQIPSGDIMDYLPSTEYVVQAALL